MDEKTKSLVDSCERMFAGGANTESVLAFLRRNGCSQINSIRSLVLSTDLSLAEAKKIVHLSQTWEDARKSNDDFHDQIQGITDCDQR
jgi:hypothetical protein